MSGFHGAVRRMLAREEDGGHRRRSHDGKVPFASMAAACSAADDMEAAHPGHLFEGYKCAHCAHYHVGHRKGAQMTARVTIGADLAEAREEEIGARAELNRLLASRNALNERIERAGAAVRQTVAAVRELERQLRVQGEDLPIRDGAVERVEG